MKIFINNSEYEAGEGDEFWCSPSGHVKHTKFALPQGIYRATSCMIELAPNGKIKKVFYKIIDGKSYKDRLVEQNFELLPI